MLYDASFGETVTLDLFCAGHIKNDRPEKHNTRLAFHCNMDTQNRKDAERMKETRWCPLPCWFNASFYPKGKKRCDLLKYMTVLQIPQMKAVSEHLQQPKITTPVKKQPLVQMELLCSGYGPFIGLPLTLLAFQQLFLIVSANIRTDLQLGTRIQRHNNKSAFLGTIISPDAETNRCENIIKRHSSCSYKLKGAMLCSLSALTGRIIFMYFGLSGDKFNLNNF